MCVVNIILLLASIFNPPLYQSMLAAGYQMYNYVPGLADAAKTSNSVLPGSNHAVQTHGK